MVGSLLAPTCNLQNALAHSTGLAVGVALLSVLDDASLKPTIAEQLPDSRPERVAVNATDRFQVGASRTTLTRCGDSGEHALA